MAAYHTYFYGGKHDFGDALQRVVDAENEVLNIDGIPRSARGHAVVNAAAEAKRLFRDADARHRPGRKLYRRPGSPTDARLQNDRYAPDLRRSDRQAAPVRALVSSNFC